jgi:hypothetical protein
MKINLAQLINVISISVLVACQSTPVSIPESQLLGDWQSLTNDQLKVSFSIADSGQFFQAYINGDLEKQGHWKLNGNKLIVAYNPSAPDEISIALDDDTLTFIQDNEQFVKINLPDEANSDSIYSSFDILDDINDNLGSKFSSLKATDEAGLPVTYKWQVMNCPVILESDDMETINETCEQIISILTLNGYQPDSILSNRKWLVYHNGRQKIVIRYKTPEAPTAGDTVSVEVICGTR